MASDPRIDAYIAGNADFARPILIWLRARVHAACPSVVESIKWSRPAFSYKGRPLASMAAFGAHATFSLWRCETIGRYRRIESMADVPGAAVIEDQLRAAMALIDAGPLFKRTTGAARPEAVVPGALAEALARDDAAAATFDAFPPSQRREYCEWIAEAKRAETRDRRVADAIAWLREGKRRNWKYESC